MITQLLLDVLAFIFSAFIDGFPELPSEVSWSVGAVASQAAALAPSLATLGPLVPFAQINTVLALFPAAVLWWLTITLIRGILWLVNR